ncbi:hypothetical protein F5Y13DRAFT_153653 [Hypoxylon sp. FL1857]|nr:hypothetical protein F5Y13DRAFT_153653 [Hypoxylon sp. FL1857]
MRLDNIVLQLQTRATGLHCSYYHNIRGWSLWRMRKHRAGWATGLCGAALRQCDNQDKCERKYSKLLVDRTVASIFACVDALLWITPKLHTLQKYRMGGLQDVHPSNNDCRS